MSGPLTGVQRRLGEIRGSLRTLYAADWLGRFLTFAAAFVAVTFFLDYFLILPAPIRIAFLVAGVGYALHLSRLRLVRPLGMPISDDDLALLVERDHPDLGYRLISSIQLQRSYGRNPDFNSPELVDALVSETASKTESIDFSGILNRTPALKSAGVGIVLALLIGASAWGNPEEASIYLRRIVGLNTRWPQKTFFKVLGTEEGDRRIVIARGDDVPILVEVTGEVPARVYLEYEFARTGERGRERMPSLGNDRFQYVFQQVLEEFEFRIVAYNADTDPYRVVILSPPGVGDPELYCQYPAYLKLRDTPTDQPERDPNMKVPMHTRVRVRAVADEDVEHAELMLGSRDKGRIRPIEPEADGEGRPRVLAAEFEVDQENLEYSFRVRGRNGLWNRNPLRYTLKGLPDEKPVIQVVRPRVAVEEVTKECQKRILLRVSDDHGIALIRMRYRKTAEGPPRYLERAFGPEQLVPPQYGERNLTVTDILDFRALAVVEDEAVEILFGAEDYKDIGARNESDSRTVYTFRIVPLSALEKKLEQEISRIKDELGRIRGHQVAIQGRTDWLRGKYQASVQLKPDEATEIRSVSLEQNSVTDRLARIYKEVEYVRERGVENAIFDERSDKALERVLGLLDYLTTDRSQPPGPSYSAAQALHNAWRIQRADLRDEQFLAARRLENEVIQTLDTIIQTLDLWSNYQEVIRMVRETYELQRDVAKRAELRRRCGTCRTGTICPIHR
jgi:hypothetical protein